MSFVYPWFLWALLAVAIPIIIHLFHFRRFKTVNFTNVNFLKEVKEQTSSRKKLRNFLVLLMRIFAVAFLVFAFSMPYIPSKDGNTKAGSRDVSIFFDNSFSMSSKTEDVRLLEKARRRAEEIVSAYGPDDKIQILTSDFEGRDQRLLSKDDALTRIREVRITHNVQDLSKALARQKQAVEGGDNLNKEIYMISDYQRNITDLEAHTDSTYSLYLIPLQSVQNRNISIDSAWFISPVQTLNEANEMVIKVHNWGDGEVPEARLSININGEERPIGQMTLPAKTTVYDTVNVSITKTGWHEAKLNITDFPVEFDNEYYFSFYVAEQVNILEIYENQPNRYIQAAFRDNPYFSCEAKSVNQLDYSALSKNELLVISGLKSIPSGLISELYVYVDNGGNLAIFPHADADLGSYNKLCQTLGINTFGQLDTKDRSVSYINFEEFIFNDVFEERRDNLKLPKTKRNFKMARRASTGEEVLLRYRDGGTFVGKFIKGKGTAYLCAAPLDVDDSDLVQNGEIFIPMLYRMALAKGQEDKIAYIIGEDNNLETDNQITQSEMVFKMGGRTGEFIPEQKPLGSRVLLGINNQVKESGHYSLFLKENEVLDKFSFNYDRRESDLSFLTNEQLVELVGENVSIIEGTYAQDFTNIIAGQSKGTSLWKWCLILTLVFLALETVLLRIWKE